MELLSLPSGPYKGKHLSTVPESVLAAFYKKTKFTKPATQALKAALKLILLQSLDSKIVNLVYLKNLEELLFSPLDKKRQAESLRRQRIVDLIEMFNHSPNHGFNGKLNVQEIADTIISKKS